MTAIVIVGDRFKEFSQHQNVYTLSEALKLLDQKNGTPWENVSYGQGLSLSDIRNVFDKLNNHSLSRMENNRTLNHRVWETRGNTHKRKEENILITAVECEDEHLYRCELAINEECAELSDHMTGQHIQGMVLIEACRQMVNSVAERFLIRSGTEKSFVLHALNSDFKNYVFPLGCHFSMKVYSMRHGLNGDFTAKCDIDVIQNFAVCLKVNVKFSAFDKKALAITEQQMASKSIKQIF